MMGRPRKPLTPEQERQIITLRRKGHTWRQIGEAIGINHMRAARYAQKVLGFRKEEMGGRPYLSGFRGAFDNSKM